jgi:hypothetical protein
LGHEVVFAFCIIALKGRDKSNQYKWPKIYLGDFYHVKLDVLKNRGRSGNAHPILWMCNPAKNDHCEAVHFNR